MKSLDITANNKGSSLITVIVSTTLVGILVTMTFAASVMGFQMKQVEKLSEEHFYNTETILNQVCTGLEELANNKLKEAYTYVLTRYATNTEEEKETLLKQKYVDFLKQATLLQAGINSTEPYGSSFENDRKKEIVQLTVEQASTLCNWLQQIQTKGTEEVTISNKGNMEVISEKGFGENQEEYSVTIRNVSICYIESGYETTISTDIKLNAPDYSFAQKVGKSNNDNIKEFALIAEDTIHTDANTQITGNVYGGKSIISAPGSDLYIYANQVISRGTLEAIGSGKIQIDTNPSCQLWLDNIKTRTDSDGSAYNSTDYQIKINAESNIYNDLVMDNSCGNVQMAGAYYGYGMVEGINTETYGSSIAVNATGASLDLSSLAHLTVAGRASLNLSKEKLVTNSDNFSIVQGESISYKWAQKAYLLPSDCIPSVGHNPMTLEEFNGLTGGTSIIPLDKIRLERFVPISLRKHLNPEKPYLVVHVNHYTGNLEDPTRQMVYLYMNFITAQNASTFFSEYASIRSQEMERLATVLSYGQIKLNTGDIKTSGNRLSFDLNKVKAPDDDFGTETGTLTLAESNGKNSDFSKLAVEKKYKRNGLVSYLDEGKKIASPTNTLINNLINTEAIKSKNGIDTRGEVDRYGNVIIIKKQKDVSGNTAFKVGNEQAPKGLVVIDGDVEVEGNFTGIILATGSIKVPVNATIHANPAIFNQAIETHPEIQEYFNITLMNEPDAGNDDADIPQKNLDRIIISFENWRKS